MPPMAQTKDRTDLDLSVQYASGEEEPPSPQEVRRLLEVAFVRSAQVTVRFVGKEEGSDLNRRYRGGNGPTNVLTFDYGDSDGVISGDIVLCGPVVRAEASEHGLSCGGHYAHLLVHGALHLQGYRHDATEDAAAMERRETEILDLLGIESPWEAGR